MRVLKMKALTLKSWLPLRVPMDIQYDLALTAKKLVGVKGSRHITVEFRSGSGNPLGQADWAWCKAHMEGPHPLETLIHELCHIKDFYTGKKFGQWNKRWGNRIHERRAVRDTERIMEGELSERRSAYRDRCVELMASISELLVDKPAPKKKSINTDKIQMSFSGESAGDFICYMVDTNSGSDDEMCADSGTTWGEFSDWVQEHYDYRRDVFRCAVSGNEEMLGHLAGELSYWSFSQSSFSKRAERITEVLKEAKKSA